MHWLTSRSNMPSSCVMVCATVSCEEKHIKHIHAHVICSCHESNHVCARAHVCVCVLSSNKHYSSSQSDVFVRISWVKAIQIKKQVRCCSGSTQGLRCWGWHTLGWIPAGRLFHVIHPILSFPTCLYCQLFNKRCKISSENISLVQIAIMCNTYECIKQYKLWVSLRLI